LIRVINVLRVPPLKEKEKKKEYLTRMKKKPLRRIKKGKELILISVPSAS